LAPVEVVETLRVLARADTLGGANIAFGPPPHSKTFHTLAIFPVALPLRVSHIWRPGWGPCWEGLAHGACCLEGKFPEGCVA